MQSKDNRQLCFDKSGNIYKETIHKEMSESEKIQYENLIKNQHQMELSDYISVPSS